MPSKPCLWLSGPPAPKPVTVVRMIQDDVGLDEPQAVEVEGQRAQHLRRQIGDDDVGGGDELLDDLAALRDAGSRVIPSLLRFIARNIAPPPAGPAPTGMKGRSSPPPSRSMRITSAPRSARSAAQNGPAMYRPKSRMRMPSNTPANAASCHLRSPVASSLADSWLRWSAALG